MRATYRRWLCNLGALSAGCFVGASLAAVSQILPWLVGGWHGREYVILTDVIIAVSIRMSLFYAILIAPVASLIWWALGKMGFNRLCDAMMLGFVLPPLFWNAQNFWELSPYYFNWFDVALALFGMIAGTVTWRLSIHCAKNPQSVNL